MYWRVQLWHVPLCVSMPDIDLYFIEVEMQPPYMPENQIISIKSSFFQLNEKSIPLNSNDF